MAVSDDDAIRSLVAAEPTQAEDRPALAGWLQRMCRSAARHVPAGGVGVSLVDTHGGLMPAAASNAASRVVEELQYTLGEGPCMDASASGRAVLVPDLSEGATPWPAYSAAAHGYGVGAVFAFPLQVGVARVGAMDVYRAEPGELSPDALRRAFLFAQLAVDAVLEVGDDEEAGGWVDDLADGSYRIYQAQGMVMIQLGVPAREALSRIRAYAYAHDRPLSEVAADIVGRMLTLTSDQPPRGLT